MAVNLLSRGLVLGYKLSLYVFGGGVKLIGPRVFGKTNSQQAAFDLLLEQILLVQEQYDGRVDKPLVIADRVEEPQALMHAIRGFVLVEHLVVFAQRHTEYDGGHVLEAVNPLFTLRPLASHVKQTKV